MLDAEPKVLQVGINFADAVKLTGTCAEESVVHRAPDAGRYVLADVIASGLAMFDTTRLDAAGGLDGTDPEPITELGRHATTGPACERRNCTSVVDSGAALAPGIAAKAESSSSRIS